LWRLSSSTLLFKKCDTMPMRLISTDGRLVRLGLSGRVSQVETPDGTDPIVDLLGEEAYQRSVLLDMAETEMIDSSGIGWLLLCHKRFQEGRGKLVCHSVPPLVGNVFKLMRINQVISITGTREEAEQLAREQTHE